MKYLSILLFVVLAFTSNATPNQPQEDKENVWETAWDILNVCYDGGKIAWGYCTANPALVSSGFIDLSVDVTAMFNPGLPAGTSKLSMFAVKEGAKLTTKTISKEAASAGIAHIIKRHAANRAATERGGRFFVSSVDDITALMVKAKARISQGYANVQFSAPTGAVHYIIDMGEAIGQTYMGSGKYKATNVISFAINPNTKDLASFCPALAKTISKEARGFYNILK